MTPERPRVNLVVYLPGAVSAGTYAAGVLDLLVEALDAFSEASQRGDAPAHDVVLTAISGTSAGAQSALIFASAIGYRFAPAVGDGQARNPFFEHWVVRNDLRDYLTVRDAPMRSLLDPTNVDAVADSVLRFGAGLARVRRPWVADTLRLGVAVSNLRGVPTPYPLGAGWGQLDFTRRGDAMHFALGDVGAAPAPPPAAGEQACPLPDRPEDKPLAWSALGEACVASGAFPLLFAARSLERPASGAGHRFCAVDGGLFEGNPLDVAARLVAAGGSADPTVFLRIGPPPPPPPEGPSRATGLLHTFRVLAGAIRAEARDRPDALHAQARPPLHARFAIAPNRPGFEGGSALASAGLGGFAGYFSEAFRVHDFQLGRANARAALAGTLCLPAGDPLFARWTEAQVRDHAVGDGLPVIPLVGPLREREEAWPVPPGRDVDLDGYAAAMRRRVAHVLLGLRPPARSWLVRGLCRIARWTLVPLLAYLVTRWLLGYARSAIAGPPPPPPAP
ncbi:MAG: patatin-like phospholipase family protein [Ramlibacter sp.]